MSLWRALMSLRRLSTFLCNSASELIIQPIMPAITTAADDMTKRSRSIADIIKERLQGIHPFLSPQGPIRVVVKSLLLERKLSP